MVDSRYSRVLTGENETPCGGYGLICKNGSTCGQESGGDQLHAHLGMISQITSEIGHIKHYCDCNEGYAGEDCSVEVSECTAQRSDLVHSCYYGSTCVAMDNNYGLLDRYCDCSAADVEGGAFVAGLMCQYQSTSICVSEKNTNDAKDQFCVNGGECKAIVDPKEDHPGCICDTDKWEGKHCEFEKGTLFDDALDLFQQRLSQAKTKNFRGVDDLSWVISGSDDGKANDIGAASPDTISSALVGIAAGFCAALLVAFGVRKSKRETNQYEKAVLAKDTDSSSAAHPPLNVFLPSRKTEIEETDDDVSLVPQEVSEHQVPPTMDEELVEVLDAETSQMLEAQFSQSTLHQNAFEKTEEESYDDEENENSDDDCGLLTLSRITANSGMYPLIENSSSGTSEMNEVEDTDLGPSTGFEGIRSMDGDDREEDDSIDDEEMA